jgi:uncharacterized protein (UPF0303 family)
MSDVGSEFTATAALLQEEVSLRLPAVNELTCYEIGSAIAARSVENNLPVTVAVYLGDRLVYKAALPGSSVDNDVVIAGKQKVSGIGNHSSLYERNRHLESGTTFEEATGSGFPEYAPFGGAVPLHTEDGQPAGLVIVSGLTQEEDHSLAVAAIAASRDRA